MSSQSVHSTGRGTFNVIKDSIEIEGDVRYMNAETQQLIEQEVRRITGGIELEFNVNCDLTYTADYPPLYNDPETTENVVSLLEGIQTI